MGTRRTQKPVVTGVKYLHWFRGEITPNEPHLFSAIYWGYNSIYNDRN